MRMDNGLLIRARTTKIIVNRYESELTSFVIDHACSGGIMVDVGASVGIFALQVAPCFKHLICIEPSRADATLLHQNLHLNWRDIECFEIHEVAAGEVDGELNLLASITQNFVPEIDTGQFSEADIAARGLRRIVVPSRTVDSLVDGRGPVHFLKIDVEGFEPAVLRGATHTITSNRRILVQVEGMGDRSDLFKHLISLGLTMFRPDRPSRQVNTIDELNGCRDFYAVGPEHPLTLAK